jgi:DNA-binding NarL/FixJ family response regulator
MMNIRVAIADDHPMIISGLQNMLSNYPHILLCNTYTTGTALLEDLKSTLPDVLLLDIQLPDITGDKLASVILKKYPEVKILILTNLDSTLYVHNMLRNGVHGYILKNIEPKILTEAIETVYNGGEYVDPLLKEKLEHFKLHMKKESYLAPKLTIREREILQLIVNGNTSEEIAQKLFISHGTVEHYRINILLKMDVKNTAALVKKALTLGYAE